MAREQTQQLGVMEDLTRLFVVCGKAAEVLLDHATTASGYTCVEGTCDVVSTLFRSICLRQLLVLLAQCKVSSWYGIKEVLSVLHSLLDLHHHVCNHSTYPEFLLQPITACVQCAVAYVKFDKASSAARALEVMHEAVLNEGRGPLLKVFLAEAPSSRYVRAK